LVTSAAAYDEYSERSIRISEILREGKLRVSLLEFSAKEVKLTFGIVRPKTEAAFKIDRE